MFAAACQKTEADTVFLRLMIAAVEAEPVSYKQADETSLASIAILKRHPELPFVKGIHKWCSNVWCDHRSSSSTTRNLCAQGRRSYPHWIAFSASYYAGDIRCLRDCTMESSSVILFSREVIGAALLDYEF